MGVREINFDGLIGPSHNYAGLSLGNLASARNAGGVARPMAAALQGIEKMRANLALGLEQGLFFPLERPNAAWLALLGTTVEAAEPALQACALSASSMWAANAATISPASDTGDGKCHLTIANLLTMPHRSHEWTGTLAQLRLAFAAPGFVVHAPIPAPFGDEGAANHMRLCERHDAPGVEVFVYGAAGGPFPARQHVEASRAIARTHRLDPARTLFVQQSAQAIAAGAFHNDVVAVANERVLFAHEQAFANREGFYTALQQVFPAVEIVEVPANAVTLADAVQSYLFNAQLVSLPDGGGMALILPVEAQENARVWGWLTAMAASNGPIRQLVPVNVRQSMANGGGPACLRLRVVCDPAQVDPRFIATPQKLDRLSDIVARYWPGQIDANSLGHPALLRDIRAARMAALAAMGLEELA